MYKPFILAALVLLSGCREEHPLASHLGPYYGGFDTALTPDPGDDLNPNECPAGEAGEHCRDLHANPLSHLLLNLELGEDDQLTLAFYRSPEDLEANRPMYLSKGCLTTVGPASDYRVRKIDEDLDETQVLATASFPLQFGRQILACTDSARFASGSKPQLDLALQVNPVTGASAVSLTLERSRRDGNYLYVKQDGEKIPVKLDLRYVGEDRLEARRLCAEDDETLLENKDGYEGVCVMTGRDKWSVVLPVSVFGPGVTAFWGSTRSPHWRRTTDEPDVVTYHRGIFMPVELEEEMGDGTR